MVVEGDSLRVIQAINEARPVCTMYGHVIDDIRFLSSTVSCSFLHVKWKGIKLVHALTCRAVSSIDTDVWLEDLHNNSLAAKIKKLDGTHGAKKKEKKNPQWNLGEVLISNKIPH